MRRRAKRPIHAWFYDFVEDRTHEGSKYRLLNILDELERECLAIRIDQKLNSTAVVDVLSDLFILRGMSVFIRSDNGPEFIAGAVQVLINALVSKTAYITPGSPWENDFSESFNAHLPDDYLTVHWIKPPDEVQRLIEA